MAEGVSPGFDDTVQQLVAPDPNTLLPDNFKAALQSINDEKQAIQQTTSAMGRKAECHAYLKRWLAAAMQYRRANYEPKWDRYRRNARSIYDPQKNARKESWQARMFVPITMQHKEIIKGTLYRTLISGLPINIKPRASGDENQALCLRDLVKRELERSEFEIRVDPCLDEILTYGTGFMKYIWDQKTETRSIRKPVLEQITQDTLHRLMQGQPPRVIGYTKSPQQRVVYRGMRAHWVSIWDIFLPHNPNNAQDFETTALMHRVRVPYQDLLQGVQAGYYFQEAVTALRNEWEDGRVDIDRQLMNADLYRSQMIIPRVLYEKQHTLFEYWGPLPAKWVFVRPEDEALLKAVGDPETLVPCKALFNATAFCAIDENPSYNGRHPFVSENYIKVGGDVYGVGVGEMLEQIQDDLNETSNQSKDNVQLILNKMIVILERAIVSRADLTSRPGGILRIKGTSVDDVNKAFTSIEFPDISDSSYKERETNERLAQELTGATRVTMAEGGEDVTRTASGMNLLRTIANERIAYNAMLIESGLIRKTYRAYYSEIYNNIQPDEVARILGPQRASYFQLMPPEEVEQDYKWTPEGVFSNMHQPEKYAQWMDYVKTFAGAPWFNMIQGAEMLGRAADVPDLDKLIVMPMLAPGMALPPEDQMQLQMMGPMGPLGPMMMGPGGPMPGGPGQQMPDAGPPRPGQPRPSRNGKPPSNAKPPRARGIGPVGPPMLGGTPGMPGTMPPAPVSPQ